MFTLDSRVAKEWAVSQGGVVELDAFVRLHARAGDEGAGEEALHEVARAPREEAACVSFQVFRGARDGLLFYIHSRWVEEEAFRVHAELEHTLRFLKRVDA